MPLKEICEPSITHSTMGSIKPPKSCNNVNYSYSSFLTNADAASWRQPGCLACTFGSFHSLSERQSLLAGPNAAGTQKPLATHNASGKS